MTPYLFYKDGQLLCVILPEEKYKNNCTFKCGRSVIELHTCGCYNDYCQAKDEAIANALSVSNPEIIPNDYIFPNMIQPKVIDEKLYQWPGTIEVLPTVEDGGGCFVAGEDRIKLILPSSEESSQILIK